MVHTRHAYRVGDEPVPGYHLVKFLGKGQFGEVWKATAPGGVEVALKLINLLSREGIREFSGLKRIKSIKHANLCPLSACWVKTIDGQVLEELPETPAGSITESDTISADDPSCSLQSQLVELVIAMGLGTKSLMDRLKECRREGQAGIPVDELLEYMRDSAKGLDHLNKSIHDLGQGPERIIHGDIKPHNLLLVGDSVQVCDFGLARAISNLRKTATAMGTFAYAAPELIYGHPHATSDQYCLAVTYVELRTGKLPFSESNPLKVAELHRSGRLDYSRLPRAEQHVIQRATSPRPDHRWSSCGEMVRELEKAIRHETSGSSGLGSMLWSLLPRRLSATMVDSPTSEIGRTSPAGEVHVPSGSGGGAGSRAASASDAARPGSAAPPGSGQRVTPPPQPSVAAGATSAPKSAVAKTRAPEPGEVTVKTQLVSPSDELKHAETQPPELTVVLPKAEPRSRMRRWLRRLSRVTLWAVLLSGPLTALLLYTKPGQEFVRSTDRFLRTFMQTLDANRRTALVADMDETLRERLAENAYAEAQRAFARRQKLQAFSPEEMAEHHKTLMEVALRLAADAPEKAEELLTPEWPPEVFSTADRAMLREQITKGRTALLIRQKDQDFQGLFKTGRYAQAGKTLLEWIEIETPENRPKVIAQLTETLSSRLRELCDKKVVVTGFSSAKDLFALIGALPEAAAGPLRSTARDKLLEDVQYLREINNHDLAFDLIDSPGAALLLTESQIEAQRNRLSQESAMRRIAQLEQEVQGYLAKALFAEAAEAFGRLVKIAPPTEDAGNSRTRTLELFEKLWLEGLKQSCQSGNAEQVRKLCDACRLLPDEKDRGRLRSAARLVLDDRLQQLLPHDPAQLPDAKQTTAAAAVIKWARDGDLLPPDELEVWERKIADFRNFQLADQAEEQWNRAEKFRDALPALKDRVKALALDPAVLAQRRRRLEELWTQEAGVLMREGHTEELKRLVAAGQTGADAAGWQPLPAASVFLVWKEAVEELQKKSDRDALEKAGQMLAYANEVAAGQPNVAWKKQVGLVEKWRDTLAGKLKAELDADKAKAAAEALRKEFQDALTQSNLPVAKVKFRQREELRPVDAALLAQWGQEFKTCWEQQFQQAALAGRLEDLKVLLQLPLQEPALKVGGKPLVDADAELQRLIQSLKGSNRPQAEKLATLGMGLGSPFDASHYEMVLDELRPKPPPPPVPPAFDTLLKKAMAGLPGPADKRLERLKDLAQLVDKEKLLRLSDARLDELCRVVSAAATDDLAGAPRDQALDAAQGLFRSVAQKLPPSLSGAAVYRALGGLWEQRIEAWLTGAAAPPADDFTAFQADWQRCAQEGQWESPLLRAWEAEGLFRGGQPTDRATAATLASEALMAADTLAEPLRPYVAFVAAKSQSLQESPDWDDLVTRLTEVVAGDTLPSFLAAQGRLLDACRMAVNAVDNIRQKPPYTTNLALLLGGLGWRSAKAAAYYDLLERTSGLSKGKEAGAAWQQLNDFELQQLRIGLALAAYHRTPRDLKLIAEQLAPKFLAKEKELPDDVLKAQGKRELALKHKAVWTLAVGVQGLRSLPAESLSGPDALLLIQAGNRLLRILGAEAGVANVAEAQKLYAEWLAPLAAAAERMKADVLSDRLKKSPPELDELYGRLAAVLSTENGKAVPWQADWYPRDVVREAERLYTAAIDLYVKRLGSNAQGPKLADYHLERGVLRAELPGVAADAILTDAAAVLQNAPNLDRGFALRAHGYLVRSRGQAKLQGCLEDLGKCIEDGEAVLAKAPAQARENPYYVNTLIILSYAHVEKGNFERDSSLVKQRTLLTQSQEYAEQARKLQSKRPNVKILLSLGNALEDLAWLCNDRPEENYPAAVETFRQAVQRQLGNDSQPYCSLGRCSFRLVFCDYLDPARLGLDNRQPFIEKIEAALKRACQDPDNMEARSFLGQLYHYQAAAAGSAAERDRLFQQAEQQYAQGKEIALRLKDPFVANYLVSWARAPLDRMALLQPNEPGYADELEKAEKECRQRSIELAKAPPAPRETLVPQKEVERLAGDAHRLRGNMHVVLAAEHEAQGRTAEQTQARDRALPELQIAIKTYNKALAIANAPASSSDFQLLLARAEAHRLASKCQAGDAGTDACQAAITDAEQARDLAFSRFDLGRALFDLSQGCIEFAGKKRDDLTSAANYLDAAIDNLKTAIALAPRGPTAHVWRFYRAQAIKTKIARGMVDAAALPAVKKEAITTLQEVQMADPNGKLGELAAQWIKELM